MLKNQKELQQGWRRHALDEEEEEGNQDHHREEDNQDRRMGEVEEEPLLTSEYVKRCRRTVPVNETPHSLYFRR